MSTASFVNPETGVRAYGASASKAYKERPNGTFTAAVNEGESYVFQNGAWQEWSDFLDKADTGEFVVDNFSIKLYATPPATPTPSKRDRRFSATTAPIRVSASTPRARRSATSSSTSAGWPSWPASGAFPRTADRGGARTRGPLPFCLSGRCC